MNKYQAIIAPKLAKAIEAQEKWLKEQDEDVTVCLIGECRNKSYDLRQHVQALATGQSTRKILLDKFQEECGMSYEEYKKMMISQKEDSLGVVKKFFALMTEEHLK